MTFSTIDEARSWLEMKKVLTIVPAGMIGGLNRVEKKPETHCRSPNEYHKIAILLRKSDFLFTLEISHSGWDCFQNSLSSF